MEFPETKEAGKRERRGENVSRQTGGGWKDTGHHGPHGPATATGKLMPLRRLSD